MSEQIVLRCEDSLEGIFTALFDAFVCKNKMKAPYTDSISIDFVCQGDRSTDRCAESAEDGLQYTVETGVSGV